MVKVAIVILHYKGKEFTDKCLSSVKKLKKENFKLQVIVVNNNPDEKIDDLRWKYANFSFINTGKNLGFVGGNNLGIKKALETQVDFVFVLNNDTIVEENMMMELVKAAKSHPETGIFSPLIYFAKNHEFHFDRYKESERGKVVWFAGGIIDWKNVLTFHKDVDEVDKGQFKKIKTIDFATGCGILIRASVFEKTGLLDEKYFLYFEDSDFSVRVKRQGFKIMFIPKAKMWHFNAGSSGVGGSLQDYYLTRNRLLFGMRYASLRAKFALLRWGISRMIIGTSWQKKGFIDFLKGNFGKGSYEA